MSFGCWQCNWIANIPRLTQSVFVAFDVANRHCWWNSNEMWSFLSFSLHFQWIPMFSLYFALVFIHIQLNRFHVLLLKGEFIWTAIVTPSVDQWQYQQYLDGKHIQIDTTNGSVRIRSGTIICVVIIWVSYVIGWCGCFDRHYARSTPVILISLRIILHMVHPHFFRANLHSESLKSHVIIAVGLCSASKEACVWIPNKTVFLNGKMK